MATASLAVAWAGCGGSDSTTTPTPDASTDGTASTCPSGQNLCGNVCSTPATDPQNCGACGMACGSGQVCNAGKCTSSCSSSQTTCTSGGGSYCATTATDNANCGACGKTCTAGQVCSQGTCGSACGGTGETLCAPDAGTPYCAITASDNANCGSCGNACATGQVCTNGTCAIAPCAGANDLLCTPEGGAPYCVNKNTDNANCGSCGHACGTAQVCVNGACTQGCGVTDGGTRTYCAPDGGTPYCTDTATDNANCGACGNKCTGSQVCSNGTCSFRCGGNDGGELYCAPDGGVAYCANVQIDNANCGACGNTCSSQTTCTGGKCCQSILLLGTAAATPTTLITQLQAAEPTFCTIDFVNVNTAVPTLAKLMQYKAVLVYNENGIPYSNAGAIGDVVANYFDTGGRVVIALFADGGYAITGGWTARNYNMIAAIFVGQLADTWVSTDPAQNLVPSSPILVGVNTITANASAWHGTQATANGGAAVAKWASGRLLAVAGTVNDSSARSRKRVDLNIQPTDVVSGVYTGDAIKLIANSLLYE